MALSLPCDLETGGLQQLGIDLTEVADHGLYVAGWLPGQAASLPASEAFPKMLRWVGDVPVNRALCPAFPAPRGSTAFVPDSPRTANAYDIPSCP